MKTYGVSGLNFAKEQITEFFINNLNSISASIKSIITQVRRNSDNIDKINVNLVNVTIQAWSTTDRPTNTGNDVTIGVNTTTGKINYTTDGGSTWFNYDGTAA